MDLFSKAFGIKITDDNPDGSSGYEITTITSAPASKIPDQTDIGITFGINNVNLFAPYKPQSWNDISATYRDPKARWLGSYAGQIAIQYPVGLPKSPTKLADLADPAFKGMFAIGGDPVAAQESLMSVFTANLAAGGTNDNIQKGIDWFKSLKASGNFVTVPATPANFAAGAYKVSLTWDYNCPDNILKAAKVGVTLKCVIPSDAILLGTPYVTAIPKTAPHPATARLWTEFLYSGIKGKFSKDLGSTKGMSGSKIFSMIMGGQNIWISGGAHPITEVAMRARGTAINPPAGVIPAMGKSVTPNVAQQDAATALLKDQWPAIAAN
jgi:putative spermidine/putrescine transport system substrate-binding protein